MNEQNGVIEKTQNWISEVVIGFNFCPFAARPFKDGRINYRVVDNANLNSALQHLMQECFNLEHDKHVETTFIIFPDSFADFYDYLELVELSEKIMAKEGLEGIFQVASFHPDYVFSGSNENDAANYTNRSPYPMLHILREDGLEEAIKKHPDTGKIPEKNILTAREKGISYMKNLLENIRKGR